MLSSDTPTRVPLPFANSGTKNAIPTASQIGITAGAASLTDGFPPLTFTPIAAGGVPPFGADFNGVLNLITATVRWIQAGGQFGFNTSFNTAVTGYPKGAVLQKATLAGSWLNTVEGNTTNPDTGGAGWLDNGYGRLLKTSVYSLVGGVLNVSVNGGANTTVGAGSFTTTTLTTLTNVKVVSGGGAGGGAQGTGAGQQSAGGGGAGGAYGESWLTGSLAAITITVGAGGAPGPLGLATGGAGGTSSFGSSIICTGGAGGPPGGVTSGSNVVGTATPGTSTGGNAVNASLMPGGVAIIVSVGAVASGPGGAGLFGGGATSASSTSGLNARGVGAGGSGGACLASTAAGAQGGSGFSGIVMVYEYGG